MQTQELELYLHRHIPLTQAMQVTVLSVEPDQLILQAPLAPNINPHQTAFGGSVVTLATLAAWCLLYTRLELEGIANHLVIRRSTLDYEQPIAGDFKAIARLAVPEQWGQAVELLKQRGKAKLPVLCVLEYQGQITGRFQGEFVAKLAG
ncbi:thioesterase domain-containing protein, putative [Thiothrix eikelboomii]|uniref:Thioesterase domain-containing protein, putative n=1 Tax=Thiothrix eikelboomii TaxID=92487 RepID=A0A1T4WUC0_9GAMM|nr:YiiD C-terminal domain-containing protein [Thiothrix eikelboomii]SKA80465.1 thioesterase domain-containing protein, putative [Thiothrix eikelboomii]